MYSISPHWSEFRFLPWILSGVLGVSALSAQTNSYPSTGAVSLAYPGSDNHTLLIHNKSNIWGVSFGTYGQESLMSFRNGNDWTETLRLRSGEASFFKHSVGIGTTNPFFKLEVVQDNYNAIRAGGNSTNSVGIYVNNVVAGGRQWAMLSSGGGPSPVGTFSIWDDTAQAPRLNISPIGNVGVGVNSPFTVFDVYASGASDPFRARGTAHNAWISLNSGQNLILTTGQSADTGSPARDSVGLRFRGMYWDGSSSRPADTSISTIVSGNNAYRMSFWTANAERMIVNEAGNVGIGTSAPGAYKLAVNGTVRAKEVVVETTGWSDYVFADDYDLRPLSEVESHIKAHRHLPGIPSAAQVAEHGVNVGEMQAKLLAKIEELTLHQIQQEKRMSALEEQNRILKVQLQAMRRSDSEHSAAVVN
jgi:hypothetical protein